MKKSSLCEKLKKIRKLSLRVRIWHAQAPKTIKFSILTHVLGGKNPLQTSGKPSTWLPLGGLVG